MPEAAGAPSTRRSARPHGRVGTWVDHHLYSFVASLGRVARRPWSTALTVGVMAVALALPLGLWLVLANVARFSGDVQRSREISVFLRTDVDAARAQALAQALRARADIGEVPLRTPAHGLAEIRNEPYYAAFPPANPRSACNARKVPGNQAFYTATPGYTGHDRLVLQGSSPDGAVRRITVDLTVR